MYVTVDAFEFSFIPAFILFFEYSTLYISVVGAIINVSTGILISSSLSEVLTKSAITFMGGVLGGIFALGILPFLEGTFNEVTTLKLLELSLLPKHFHMN